MTTGGASTVLAWMRYRTDEMAGLLQELALAESPSNEPGAQAEMFEQLAAAVRSSGFTTRTVRGRGVGDHLFSRPAESRRGRPNQLLLGHLDTVWPTGTVATMPVEFRDDDLSGPGTYDMKSGLVQMVFALRCIRALGLDPPATPVVFVNSDEEVGSTDSTRYIRMLAKSSVRAFVLEGSYGRRGDLKTARKGVGRFTLRVKGVAAHAGLEPGSGSSAILEISQQIQNVFELNDPARGVTVNVGTVDGGLRPNVVAPEASAEIDCRVPTSSDASRVEQALRSLEPTQDGLQVEVEGNFGRPPMEPTSRNRALWELAAELGAELGLPLDEASVGGGSDGNTTSQYTATLDGLGGVGDGAHAPHEHVKVSDMANRSALLTLLLCAPIHSAVSAGTKTVPRARLQSRGDKA